MHRRVARRFVSILAPIALVIAAVAVAGCGGGGGTDTGDTAGGGSKSGSESTFTFGNFGKVNSLDPIASALTNAPVITSLAMEGLVTFDSSGKIVPALASAWKRETPTKYVYTLRKGAKFSDGSPVTMEDVMFSIERTRGAKSVYAPYFENVASVRSQGASQVIFTLKKPEANFEYVPAYALRIVSKKFVEENQSSFGKPNGTSIGTGPWKIVSFKSDSDVELERNNLWWGKEKPSLDRIIFKFFNDDQSKALALRAGEIDATETQGSAGPYEGIDNTSILESPGGLRFISFNTQVKPWSDVHVRRAFAYLVDRQEFVDGELKGSTAGKVMPWTVLPYTLEPHYTSQEIEDFYAKVPALPESLDLAKKEMAASGYPNGLEATIYGFADTPSTETGAQILAAEAAEIGITLNVKSLTSSQYSDLYTAEKHDLGLLPAATFVGFTTDPLSLTGILMDPAGAVGGGLNFANLDNKEVNEAFAEYNLAGSWKAKLHPLETTQRVLIEEAPYIPLYQTPALWIVDDKFTWETPPPAVISFSFAWALDIHPTD